jgi:hypothetical protein
MGLNVSAIVESLTTFIENQELSEICSWYVTAPIALSQLSVGVIEILFSPFAGPIRVGVSGAAMTAVSKELA